MKSFYVPCVIVMTTVLLFISGCSKEDDTSTVDRAYAQLMQDFLSDDYFGKANPYYHPTAPTESTENGTITESRTKESMTSALKDYFANNPKEVKHINQKYGYPVWQHALVFDETDGEVLKIPIAKTNKNKIEAILFIYKKKVNDELGFLLIERKNLHKLFRTHNLKKNPTGKYEKMSLEHSTILTAFFEQSIFSSIDCGLLQLLEKDKIHSNILEKRTCYFIEYTNYTFELIGNIEYITVTSSYSFLSLCFGNNDASAAYTEDEASTDDQSGGNGGYGPTKCIDKVIEGFITSCPKVNCVWNKIKEMYYSKSDNLICQFLNESPSVILTVESDNSLPSTTNARTYFSETGISTIVINDDDCFSNRHPLIYANSIFHEFIHAEIFNSIYSDDYIQGFGKSYSNIWNDYMQKNYPNLNPLNDGHHEIMANYFVDRLAGLLWDLNNNIGNIADYKYQAWSGLNDKLGKSLISYVALENLRANFVNNIVAHPNTLRCL